ncbi:RHS repeat-associated core domain-containing protein [Kitasatospora purpeofusca]|uniref:RHS repeat-associated core domain-containing protein n=1 Tax=Kitasatospora purpeofusca TaxID=67352 RepID=UPI0035DA5E3E
MATTPALFTHATNFSSAVSGGVDPRTGLFNVQIALGGLVGNRALGPSLPLTLSYSPLTTTDMGLGQGVSLPMTTYDVNERLLVLSSGEQYRVEETGTKVVLLQHKLDTVHITREQDKDGYRIVHKSGDVEILTGPRNAFDLKVPTSLVTPTGHRLDLRWDFTGGDRPRLAEVRDEQDVLLKVVYTGRSKTTLRVLPGQKEGYDVELRFRNGLLGSVHHFGLGADKPLVWDFTHTAVGQQGAWGSWITGVRTPGGMDETAWYEDDGHHFPATAGLPALPRVYRFVRTPGGGQPPIEASYDYTDTNFLGGHSDVDWDSSRDCLYDVLTEYTYGSTESRTCAGRTARVTRTYNRFHLQTAERQQQNSCSRLVETQYYAVTGKPFEDQPKQFQLPKKRTVTWTDSRSTGPLKSYPETTRTFFDKFGNPSSQDDPDGTRTVWDYYPAGGSGDDCPPEPNGFTRLLRSVTRTPPATGFDAPVHSTVYRYSLPDPKVPAVMKSEERTRVGDRLLRKQVFTYNTSDSAEFGRLVRLATTEYPDGNGGTAYESVDTTSCSVEDDTLVQAHQVTTHDTLTVKSSQTHSRFTGRLRSATDGQGNRTTMEYDRLGRLLTRTVNPDTPYKAVETRAYETGTTAPFVATATDALGNQVRESFDGAGRLIRRERQDNDDTQGDCVARGTGTWYTVRTQNYDEQGRTASTTVHDHVRGDGGGEIALTSTYAYDDWGQHSTTTLGDGSGTLTQHDPVNRTTTDQLLAAGKPLPAKTVTSYDERGLPKTVTRFDRDGKPCGGREFQYDGLGRLRTETDVLGDSDDLRHTTGYDYDAHDRVRLTTLPDTTRVSRAYAPFAAQALVTELTVGTELKAGTELTVGTASYGTQDFDGLGRLKRSASGGRTWSSTYATDAAPRPATSTGPDGKKHAYQYVPQLADALSRVEAGPEGVVTITQKFTRDPVSAAVTTAEEGGVTLTHAYYPSGRPCTDTTRLTGHPGTTARTTYTVNGLEHQYASVDGSVRRTSWDAFGRLLAVVDPAASATLRHDPAGRVIGWTTRDSASGNTLTTDLVLDDFGREVTRTLADGGGATWTLTQQWQPNDLLDRRTLKRGTTVLRDETFAYSGRNQLTAYTCVGQTPPRDQQGRAITGQRFTYDAWGNVRTCRTDFTGGSDTATYLFGNAADPCQLTGIDHDNPKSHTDLRYDAAGRLTTDDAGRTLAYDDLGRLTAVGEVGAYGYDPGNRLLTQAGSGRTSVFSYHRQALASITDGDQGTRLIRLAGTCVAQRREGTQTSTRLLGTDGKQTVLVAAEGQQAEEYAYTPYGDRRPAAAVSVLGHDGERTDPVTGWYHLGNGYRAYSPALMRFTAPDSLSPFGAGGINPYAYCAGDPVNRTDPTGHLSWGAWLNIGLGIVAIGAAVFTGGASIGAYGAVMAAVTATEVTFGVVSGATAILSGALEEAAPKASGILGYVSLGTGLVSGGASLGGKLGTAAARGLARLAARSGRYAMSAEETAAFEQGGAAYRRYLNSLPENEFGGRGGARSAARNSARGGARSSGPRPRAFKPTEPAKADRMLYHYTNRAGQEGIINSGELRASTVDIHAHYGHGQYLTDLPPRDINGGITNAGRAELLVNKAARADDYTHWLAIDTRSVPESEALTLSVSVKKPYIFLVPNEESLDLTGRIRGWWIPW